MNKIIVFGGAGQLGTCLKTLAAEQAFVNIIFPEEAMSDIREMDCLKLAFEKIRPAYVINCAAYTAVDKAEDELDLVREVNRDGAANLARMCKSYGAVLIHISTDFVFEGNIPKLLSETDRANPLSVYGLTKLEGEQAIAAQMQEFYILRTSWLYSEYGNNFAKTMLNLGRTRDELRVIADQVGTPTYAMDLASAIFHIIASEKQAYGIYHFSNEGVTSWYDFAKAIFDISGMRTKVLPIPGTEYPTKAARPAYSVMDKTKFKNTFNLEVPYWRDSLKICLEKLASN
ncbi:dTDP-4-dehydrorhamnose reductase [Pedobacter sp. SAFR-022]|uniref:dTDP-4-dehydrorhamnose reductase n=1 Tax=Pedobacter sp. SAFR-022 TaxID=3436861 RepID=UPI003F81ACC1